MATLIDEREITRLAQQYGQPLRRQFDVEIGPELFFTRFYRLGDRRGEVVLVLERPSGRLLLHTKAHYGADTYRLMTGGIGFDEAVLDAVMREVQEETGLIVVVARFLAILEYRLRFGSVSLPFVSYVFHVREVGGQLSLGAAEVAALREVRLDELAAVADHLRSIPGERGFWGRWRALAHDAVIESMSVSAKGEG